MDYVAELLTQFVADLFEDLILGPGVRDCAYLESNMEV